MSVDILFYLDEEAAGVIVEAKRNTSLGKLNQSSFMVFPDTYHYTSAVSNDVSLKTTGSDVTCSTIPGSNSLWHMTQPEWTMICDSPVLPPGFNGLYL